MTVDPTPATAERTYVFIHGTPGNRCDFAKVIALAPASARTLAVELPDHGEALLELEARLEPMEQCVLDAVEQTAGPVTLVGFSFGGWLAGKLCEQLPGRVDHFVAVSTLPTLSDDDVAMRLSILGELQAGRMDIDSDFRELVLGLFLGEMRSTLLDDEAWATYGVPKERWIRVLKRTLKLAEHPPIHFSRPVTVIHGERDSAVPYERAVALAQVSPASKFVTLDTGSHLLPLTHGKELAQIIFAP